jgi:rod shape-determining protein MreC
VNIWIKNRKRSISSWKCKIESILFNTKDTSFLKKNGFYKRNADDILVSKVIHNSYNVENFLTLNSGSNDGVKQDMGVINDLGIVGIVDNTSPKFATVVSILNVKSQINAKIKKSLWFLVWNGKALDLCSWLMFQD